MLIRFTVLNEEDITYCVECSEFEYTKLIAPAVKNNWPIDGATVDSDTLEELMERPKVKGRARHTIFLV